LYALLSLDHTTLFYAGNAAGADDVADLEAAADDVMQSYQYGRTPG
jgi:predicted YcjX-like family ATPase